MLIPFRAVKALLSSKYEVHSLSDFKKAQSENLSSSLSTATIISDHEFLDVMSGLVEDYSDFLIVYNNLIDTPIILEKNKDLTLEEFAKIYCDTPISKTEFLKIIRKTAEKQTMQATSLYHQFETYIDRLELRRKLAFTKIYRNDPCPCGSDKKFKQCHGKKS